MDRVEVGDLSVDAGGTRRRESTIDLTNDPLLLGMKLDVPDVPAVLRAAQRTWIGRMVNEYSSARVFDAFADQLARAGMGAARARECEGFAEEERRHGAMCGAVARALGASPCAPARVEGDLPEHADVDPLEAVVRNVLSISCLSETIAVTIISAERAQMPEGDVRDVLTEILADEIGHARFGWGLLADVAGSLDEAARARLGRYLEVAFAHVERHELTHLPDTGAPPQGAEALGVCSGREARELFYAAVDHVIVPRLEAVGIAAGRAWRDRPRVAPRALDGAA